MKHQVDRTSSWKNVAAPNWTGHLLQKKWLLRVSPHQFPQTLNLCPPRYPPL